MFQIDNENFGTFLPLSAILGVIKTIKLSEEETQRYHKNCLSSRILFFSYTTIVVLELMPLYSSGYTAPMLHSNLFRRKQYQYIRVFLLGMLTK